MLVPSKKKNNCIMLTFEPLTIIKRRSMIKLRRRVLTDCVVAVAFSTEMYRVRFSADPRYFNRPCQTEEYRMVSRSKTGVQNLIYAYVWVCSCNSSCRRQSLFSYKRCSRRVRADLSSHYRNRPSRRCTRNTGVQMLMKQKKRT